MVNGIEAWKQDKAALAIKTKLDYYMSAIGVRNTHAFLRACASAPPTIPAPIWELSSVRAQHAAIGGSELSIQ
jgi:hypothetical protein